MLTEITWDRWPHPCPSKKRTTRISIYGMLQDFCSVNVTKLHWNTMFRPAKPLKNPFWDQINHLKPLKIFGPILINIWHLNLTPSHCTEFKDVRRYIGVEHLDQCEVHVHSLEAHPGERSQQEIVQGRGSADAQAIVGEGWEPGVQKEEHAQPQQRSWQVDENFRWIVLTQLPSVQERQMNSLCITEFVLFRDVNNPKKITSSLVLIDKTIVPIQFIEFTMFWLHEK